MTRQSRFVALRSSISFRLIVILSGSLIALFFTYITITHRDRDRLMTDLVAADAFRASDFIKQSLVAEMMDKEREHIDRAVRLLGGEPGVEAIRIYNGDGEVRFSSQAGEIGTVIDALSGPCTACHDEEASAPPVGHEEPRFYTRTDGARVLSLVNPILNEARCSTAGCHDPERLVLGVLDVQLSIGEAEDAMAAAAWRSAVIGAAIILLSALFIAGIVYRSVHVPAKRLRAGTEALAAGELDVVIDLDRSDELGKLAESFNEMAQKVREADEARRAWSGELEDRVRRKTIELQEMNRHIIQVEKTASLGRLAATVAHELNNPLSGIVAYAKVLARKVERTVPDGPERDALLEQLEVVRAESMRCGQIVKDLLTYARENPHEFKAERLNELAERSLRLVEHHLRLRDVTTHTQVDLVDDSLTCDGDQIVQALLSLLINAVESMPDGGSVTVRTSASPLEPTARVRLEITDTGSGIPLEIRNQIFDPFFSTKSDTKGVGLGLAVVYGIIQRHGGTVTVRSNPGMGSTFTIDLPREPAAPARSVPSETFQDEWRS